MEVLNGQKCLSENELRLSATEYIIELNMEEELSSRAEVKHEEQILALWMIVDASENEGTTYCLECCMHLQNKRVASGGIDIPFVHNSFNLFELLNFALVYRFQSK